MAKGKEGVTPLIRGMVYYAQITNVIPNRRQYPSNGTTYHIHDIFSTDERGNKYEAEYKNKSAEQDGFVVGSWQWFICDIVGTVGDEISPYTPDQKTIDAVKRNAFKPKGELSDSLLNTTYGLAIVCAKDIMIADLNNNPLTEIDINFQDKLFELADAIDMWIQAKRDM